MKEQDVKKLVPKKSFLRRPDLVYKLIVKSGNVFKLILKLFRKHKNAYLQRELMKRLIVDLDNTITLGNANDYEAVSANLEVLERLRDYKAAGFEIVIATARNMRTYKGNVGKINLNTLPIITEWLKKHDVPCDELIVGKPWCGHDGFYIDDRAIRPEEFVNLSYDEISALLDITPAVVKK